MSPRVRIFIAKKMLGLRAAALQSLSETPLLSLEICTAQVSYNYCHARKGRVQSLSETPLLSLEVVDAKCEHGCMSKTEERKARAKKLVAHLKKAYPKPKTELHYKTPFQLVAAVMMSAQTTDKAVNKVTDVIYKKYKTPNDFAKANLDTLTKEIGSLSFYRNKAKAIRAAAQKIEKDFEGKVPRTVEELVTLPGVAYKTANVILGELYEIWEGIPTDTHVKRFAHRFDLADSKDLTKISKELEALVPEKDWKYVNNGLVLYGRYICKAREHDCAEHPLTKIWPEAVKRWPKAN